MKLWNHYHVATSIEDALAILAEHNGRAQIVAGGTDLLLDIQQGNHPVAEMLVDISRIPELRTIEIQEDGTALIGAGVTHAEINAHPLLRERATCLVESCGVVGGPQVRNVATLGGNVAHALPAADGTLSLVALDAMVEIASVAGREWKPIRELFAGPGRSAINPTLQLLTRFEVRLTGPGEASAFKRIMRPQGVALPVLGCAARVALDWGRNSFAAVALSLGPVGPTPTRAAEIEQELIGQPADADSIEVAAQAARAALHPRTSKYRATAAYRTEMIEVLVRDALTAALERAQTDSVREIFQA